MGDNRTYIDNLTRQYKTGGQYQPPTKTVGDYETEIKGLEREIEIATEKIIKILKKTSK